jgi:hypothetical protein
LWTLVSTVDNLPTLLGGLLDHLRLEGRVAVAVRAAPRLPPAGAN